MSFPWKLIADAAGVAEMIFPAAAPEIAAVESVVDNAPRIWADAQPIVTTFHGALADIEAHLAATAPEKVAALQQASQGVLDAHAAALRATLQTGGHIQTTRIGSGA